MRTLRRGYTQTLSIEKLIGVDGQGLPSYDAVVVVQGRYQEMNDVARGTTTTGAAGEEVKTIANIWVAGEEEVLPADGDRVTTEDGLVGIVVATNNHRGIQHSGIDHVYAKLMEQ